MSNDQFLELIQLAERHCPSVLDDLHAFTKTEALGVLRWLNRKANEADQFNLPPNA